MANENQFIRGAGMLAVLKVLEGGELYGYAIVEALAKTKGEALHLGQATVYPMLYNLEAKGLVKARWDESGPRPRKYYSLTKAGKTRLAEDADEWSAITRAMASLGLERVALLRFVAVACAACVAAVLPAAPASAALQQGGAQSGRETAVEAYARIKDRLREIAGEEGLEASEEFIRSGVVDEATRRWLEAARPLAREFTAAAGLPYARELDYSQGFGLLLPHLSEQRVMQRAARALAHDAAQRGDRALAGDLLRAQVVAARRIGEDKILISSLVAMGLTHLHIGTADELLEQGGIDQAGAKALLDARKELDATMHAQLVNAIGMEADIGVQEAARISALDDRVRTGELSAMGAMNLPQMDSESLAKWKDESAAYRDAMKAALANPDLSAMKAEVSALVTRAEQGEFGLFVKMLAPDVSRTVERLEALLSVLAEQDARLVELASGRKAPADFMNAARLYLAAAKAAESLALEPQRTVHALRIAAGDMTDADRRDARRAIEALRPGVIDRVMQAAKIKRCAFDDSGEEEPDLMPEGSEGALGALRITLFDALLPGERPSGAPSAVDACIAGVVAVRHFAEGGGIGRALVAQRFSRDVAQALAQVEANGLLDTAARERLAAELALFKPTDALGLRRAIDFERARISGMRQPPRSSRSDGTPFSRERLAKLSPEAVVFLVGVLTTKRSAIAPEPCACAFDGPLLAVRDLFDLGAIEAAQAQAAMLRQRFAKTVQQGIADEQSPLSGLTVVKPVDLEARIDEAVADFARLQAFAESKTVK